MSSSPCSFNCDPYSGSDRRIERNQAGHGRHARWRRGLSSAGVTTPHQWLLGARPRTLPAAIVPVLVGCAAAEGVDRLDAVFVANGLLALLVSLSMQVAVNYANDYSDGVRGTDHERRGPRRLVGSGDASAASVKVAAFITFGIAALSGLVLAASTTWWLVPIGLTCIAAGWTYTGGPKPYGYVGLGEVFVFVFFGLVATVGTTYVVGGGVTVLSILSGAVCGFLAVALLLVNNIRDIDGDRSSGKRTLAVRLGAPTARRLFVGCYLAAGVAILAAARYDATALLGLFGLLAALPAISMVRSACSSGELLAALAMTARAQVVVGVLYSLGLVIQ